MSALFGEPLPVQAGPTRKSFNWRRAHNGYRRHGDDWYVEPAACVHALLDVEHVIGPVLDPCCGAGNIPSVLRARGFEAIGSDIVDRGAGATIADFLSDDFSPPGLVHTIVFNPPYRAAQAMVQRARDLGVWKVCAVLRLAFLEGQERGPWFAKGGLSRVWVSSSRLNMPPGDEFMNGTVKAEGGKVAYAWFVWERGHRGPAQIGWLP